MILEQMLKYNSMSEKDNAGGRDYEKYDAEMFGRAHP